MSTSLACCIAFHTTLFISFHKSRRGTQVFLCLHCSSFITAWFRGITFTILSIMTGPLISGLLHCDQNTSWCINLRLSLISSEGSFTFGLGGSLLISLYRVGRFGRTQESARKMETWYHLPAHWPEELRQNSWGGWVNYWQCRQEKSRECMSQMGKHRQWAASIRTGGMCFLEAAPFLCLCLKQKLI